MEDKWANRVNAPCKNWVGDYVHENGNYENECMYCHGTFFGFKNRVVCHLCDNLTKDQIAYLTRLEKDCSTFAAYQCETPGSGEGGDFYCVKVVDLEKETKRLRELLMDVLDFMRYAQYRTWVKKIQEALSKQDKS